ncbi:hypothetical protein BgAZ_203320 [Babesia gibsoni]|uniref:Uncharacterized protein n=1 Tax=Babesia gibsoni TaxID=33632 RepID=A0AAD8LR71_BABGI|nr:hypothetical protein BgAZ_203320 [Babesia gibsoni]
MHTPTRRNVFGDTPLAPDITHAAESHSISRRSRSSNPFCKGTDFEDALLSRGSIIPSGLDSFISPTYREKRLCPSDIDSRSSIGVLKKSRSFRSTPVNNYNVYTDASVTSNEVTWKQRSSMLSRINDHQIKADEVGYAICPKQPQIMTSIPFVLREVEKCNMLLKDLGISL